MKRTKQVPHVPDHIIFEILRSLPGKSLARFMCVCKSWHSFLSQLKYDLKVILSSSRSLLSVEFEASSRNIKAVYLHYPLEVRGGECGYTVIGSCNGLLLVIYEEGLVIWNPWTGGHKRLSSLFDPLENFDDYGCYFYDKFGFGYDQSTDDYKLVRIFEISGSDNIHQVEIYSLKTKSCQKKITLNRQIRYIIGSELGNFVNGALYWLIHHVVGLELGTKAVLRFDLSNQEFSVILSPKEFQRREQLGVFGGRLCLLGYNRENHICMWAMEDYMENQNQNQNWIKLMIIPVPPLEETETDERFLIPVCFMNNGELLLITGQQRGYIELTEDIREFFIYNPEEKTFIEMGGIYRFSTYYQTITYTQTLVSPLMY